MDEHPLILFADGPAGRRARLLGTGKDAWEIIAVVNDNRGDAVRAACYLEIPVSLTEAAIAYYTAHTVEIDQLIEANERDIAEDQAAFMSGEAETGSDNPGRQT